MTNWYRSKKGSVIHAAACPRRGGAVPWQFVESNETAAKVDQIINAYPWLRWCTVCKPTIEEHPHD